LRRSNPASFFFAQEESWIASRSLSSGAHSRDPVARNDGVKAVAERTTACAGREAEAIRSFFFAQRDRWLGRGPASGFDTHNRVFAAKHIVGEQSFLDTGGFSG